MALRTDHNVVQLPGLIPNVGGLVGINTTITDPDFGTNIVRITDHTSGAGNSKSLQTTDASSTILWNTDDTMFVVRNTNSSLYIIQFDPIAQQAVYQLATSYTGGSLIFSTVSNNIAYYLKGTAVSKITFTKDGSGRWVAGALVAFANFNNILPAGFTGMGGQWVGTFGHSLDDSIFTTAFSLTAQDTSYTMCVYQVGHGTGLGYRMLNTQTGQITGDWGATGTWVQNSPYTSFYMHDVDQPPNSTYALISVADRSGAGYLFWDIATTTMNYTSSGGHLVKGYVQFYTGGLGGGQFSAYQYSNPSTFSNIMPTASLPASFGLNSPFAPGGSPAQNYVGDHHGAFGLYSLTDNSIMWESSSTYQIRGQAFTSCWQGEIHGLVTNGSLQEGTVYRVCHHFSSGASTEFIPQNAFNCPSQTGKFVAFCSDWMGTLGGTGGQSVGTLGTNARADVFVVATNASSGDFAVGASPSGQTVSQGGTTNYSVTVTPSGGFTGIVNLSVSGLPSGTTANFSPSSLGSGTSILQVNVGGGTLTGTYTLSATGTSGGNTHTTTVNLTVTASPDFSITETPSTLELTQGNSGNYTVTITPLNGFTDSVNLTVTGLPSGTTAGYSPSSLTSGNSTLQINVGDGTTPGSYTLTITGTDGSLVHSISAVLLVDAAENDFALSATPTSQSVVQGTTANYTVTVTPEGIFSSTVSLSLDLVPAGGIATFSPSSLTSGTSALTIDTTAVAAGTYSLHVEGVSGIFDHTFPITLIVVNPPPPADFTITQAPESQTILQGQSTTYTITITPGAGFSDTVNLALEGLPTHATAGFSTSSLTSGNSTLTINTDSLISLNSYPLTVTATSGALIHTAAITLVVESADFTLNVTPSNQTTTQGTNINYTVTVAPLADFSTTVNLSISGLPDGTIASFSPSSLGDGNSTLGISVSNNVSPGTYSMIITATSNTNIHTITITLTVLVYQTGSFAITVTPPISLVTTAGENLTCKITLFLYGNFSGIVNLSVSGLPPGVSSSFSQKSLTSGSSTLRLTIGENLPVGVYPFQVTAQSGNDLYAITSTLFVSSSVSENVPFQIVWTDVFNNLLALDTFGINFPASNSEAQQLQVRSNSATLGTYEMLIGVAFYLTGNANDVNTVQNIWPTLSETANPQLNGGVDISFDFGQTFIRFDSTHGVQSIPSSWIPLPAEAIGTQGEDGILGAFDTAHFILRYVVPPGAIQFGKLNIRLSMGFDIV